MKYYVLIFLLGLWPMLSMAQKVEIEAQYSTMLTELWQVELTDMYDFAARQEIAIEPFAVHGYRMMYLKQKTTIMFYRAVAGEPAFNILFEGDSTKPDIVIIYKNSEGMGSAGAMVTGVLWLIERQIIKLELVDFKFNIDALQKAELSVLKLRNLGFTPEDLIEAGYPLDELLEDFAISRLKKAGFTAFDFKALGFSKYNLQVSGFNSEELKEAGY